MFSSAACIFSISFIINLKLFFENLAKTDLLIISTNVRTNWHPHSDSNRDHLLWTQAATVLKTAVLPLHYRGK